LASLEELADGVYLLPGRVNIGFICHEDGCYMVDTGIDDDQARKALRALGKLGLELKAAVNTHSHADHIGGNSFVKRRAGVPILAPEAELPFVRMPLLEPMMLYGGCPIGDLRSKFFAAKPSDAEALEAVGLPFEIVNLAGHSPAMVGLQANGVFFVADAYFGLEVLRRHVLPYTYDPGAALEALKTVLDEREAELFVPSHGKPTRDPTAEVEANIRALEAAREATLKALSRATGRGLSTCQVVSSVLSELGISPRSTGLYCLYASCIRGYLAWLEREGLAEAVVEGPDMLWRPVKS